jgi:hypothetical protein
MVVCLHNGITQKMKTCVRCGKEFKPTVHNQIVCIFCRAKYIEEQAKKRKQKKVPDSKGWEGRIKGATEKRANYIADFYAQTGILLRY